MMLKALIVDDEEIARMGLQRYCRDIRYINIVETCSSASEAINVLKQKSIDLIFLDIQMPKLNGLDFIKSLSTPPLIIMTTAYPNYALEGFELDVIDYIVKPFDFQELLVRIRALLKRLHHQPGAGVNILKVGDLVMNLDSKEVTREGRAIPLTAKEFQLLEYFIRNKNKVVSRIDIAMNVWDIDFDTKTNVIDVYVNFLRKKIEKDFSSKLIYTQVGMGYVLKESS